MSDLVSLELALPDSAHLPWTVSPIRNGYRITNAAATVIAECPSADSATADFIVAVVNSRGLDVEIGGTG